MTKDRLYLPGRGFRKVERRSRLWLHWGARYGMVDTIDGKEGTFSRGSVGGAVPVRSAGEAHRRQKPGLSGQFADGRERFGMQKRNGSWRSFMRLEGASENLLNEANDLSAADWSGPATVETDAVAAPVGTLQGDKVEDTDGAVTEERSQVVTVADDSLVRCGVWLLAKRSTAPVALFELGYEGGGTPVAYQLQVDPTDGSGQDVGGTALANWEVESLNDDWWLVFAAGANNGGGNTSLRWRCYPAWTSNLGGAEDATLTGHQYLWGANLRQASFPGSHLETAGSSVSSVAESLEWPLRVGPRATAAYARWVERGVATNPDETVGALVLGDTTNSGARVLLRGSESIGLEALHFNGTGSVSSQVAAGTLGVSRLQVVEALVLLREDGSVELETAVDESGTDSGGQSGELDLAASWQEEKALLGTSGTAAGLGDYEVLKVGPLAAMDSMEKARRAW